MRKKIVIFNVLILCCISVFAQNKMPRNTFELLVDYVNCKYTAAYIELSRPEGNEKQNIAKFDKNIKEKLEAVTSENPVPFAGLSKLLKDNGWSKTEEKVSAKVNDIKKEFIGDGMDAVEAIALLKWKGDLATKFKKTEDALQKELIEKYTSQTSQNGDLSKENSLTQPSSSVAKSEQPISIPRPLVLICLVVIVLLVCALFLWCKLQFNSEKQRSSVRKFVSDEIKERYSHTLPNVGGGDNDIRIFEDKLNKLERQIGDIQSKINSIENQTTTQSTLQPSFASISKENGLYFASKSDKRLTEQQPNSTNASFRVYEINGAEAKFEYVGAVRNENWFEGVCLIENSISDNLSDKKRINTTQSGKVRKENESWVVISLAKIKFI